MSMFVMEAARNCRPIPEGPDVKRRRVVSDQDANSVRCQSVCQSNNDGRGNSLHRFSFDEPCEDPELASRQALYTSWREAEKSLPPGGYNPTFERLAEAEKIRLSGIDSIFNYVIRQNLSQTTLHAAAYYMNRLFMEIIGGNGIASSAKLDKMDKMWLYGAVATSIRTAVKIQERWENTEPFRLNPRQLWSVGQIGENEDFSKTVEGLNMIERLYIRAFGVEPYHVPVASDFLEQYLKIGAWPEGSIDIYRQLSEFVLALTLYASGAPCQLQGMPPSKLAAGALVLSVKIMNADGRLPAYEFWTKKLEAFSSYTIKELLPVAHDLSRLLRAKQAKVVRSDPFRQMFPYWSRFSWC